MSWRPARSRQHRRPPDASTTLFKPAVNWPRSPQHPTAFADASLSPPPGWPPHFHTPCSRTAVASALPRPPNSLSAPPGYGGSTTTSAALTPVGCTRPRLEATTRLIQNGAYSQPTGRRLLAILAEQAQLAGGAAFDAGDHRDAEGKFRVSLAAARDAQDRALTGNGLAFLAYQQLTVGGRGADTASAACEAAGNTATPRVRTLLHLRAAWAFAVAGDAPTADGRLGIGTTVLAEQDERQEPDWVYWVDSTEGEIMTGRCWAVLHRPLRAIPVLERALTTFSDTQARDKALPVVARRRLPRCERGRAGMSHRHACAPPRQRRGVHPSEPTTPDASVSLGAIRRIALRRRAAGPRGKRVYRFSTERLNHARYSVQP